MKYNFIYIMELDTITSGGSAKMVRDASFSIDSSLLSMGVKASKSLFRQPTVDPDRESDKAHTIINNMESDNSIEAPRFSLTGQELTAEAKKSALISNITFYSDYYIMALTAAARYRTYANMVLGTTIILSVLSTLTSICFSAVDLPQNLHWVQGMIISILSALIGAVAMASKTFNVAVKSDKFQRAADSAHVLFSNLESMVPCDMDKIPSDYIVQLLEYKNKLVDITPLIPTDITLKFSGKTTSIYSNR